MLATGNVYKGRSDGQRIEFHHDACRSEMIDEQGFPLNVWCWWPDRMAGEVTCSTCGNGALTDRAGDGAR